MEDWCIWGGPPAELTEVEACHAAEIAALNAIAGIRAVLESDLTSLLSLLRVDGDVASADEFVRIPWVLDGTSEIFRQMLGDKGAARAHSVHRAAPSAECTGR